MSCYINKMPYCDCCAITGPYCALATFSWIITIQYCAINVSRGIIMAYAITMLCSISTMPHYVITIFYCVMIMAYLNTTMLYYTITMFLTVPYSIQLCYGALLCHHNGFLCSNNVCLVFSCAIAISHCAIKRPLLPSQCFIVPAVLYCGITEPNFAFTES